MNKERKIQNIIWLIILITICAIICFFITKKEGFHEDEMFSYGSSNYKYDNVFQPYGDKDYINITIDKEILDKENPIKEIVYFLKNPTKFIDKLNEAYKEEKPVWKTKEKALEYLTIQDYDILNFGSVYYNQSRDAHPPLFYYLVHIVSGIFYGNFSKYIIFIINLILFVLCNVIIKKILALLEKQKLEIPTLILYGLSVGGISTVIFQRMYMLLTFFIVYFTYINIYIVKNNFIVEKKVKLQLGIITILGFLTQYYFCVYALGMIIFVGIQVFKKCGKNKCIRMLRYYIKLAIVGIVIFPASIYHIFFSYRGVTAISNNFGMIDFFRQIYEAFGCNLVTGSIIIIIIIIISIIILKRNKNNIPIMLLTTILIYVWIISKISPYLDLRYIMGILPIISILFWICVDYITNKNIIRIITLLIIIYSINILQTNPIKYLYSGYNNNIKIANENKNQRFIYIEDNGFNHIQSMPEFAIYKESLILNIERGELIYLENNENLKNEKELIVSIKRYMDVEKILKTITELTDFKYYQELLNNDDSTGNIIYKFKREDI